MIRSFVFTTQGKLHSKDIDMFLMPSLLSDTNLFLWVDLERPTPEETKYVLEDVFHFHPLSIEDCVNVSPSPKVDEYEPKDDDKFTPYVVHGHSCRGFSTEGMRLCHARCVWIFSRQAIFW